MSRSTTGLSGQVWILSRGDGWAREVAHELESRGYSVMTIDPDEGRQSQSTSTSPEAIVLDADADGSDELARWAVSDFRAATIVARIKGEPRSAVASAWELGVDDHISSDLDAAAAATHIELSMRRARRLLETSPLTGLPGNTAIGRELERRTTGLQPVAVVHTDLDHFKVFNNHYGFVRGDAVIEFCAGCLRRAADGLDGGQVFLGHVGGDDFVVILPADDVANFCSSAIELWDAGIADFYDPEDRARGRLESIDRRGNTQTFPIVGLSLGVASNRDRPFASPWEAAAIASEMKEFAKRQPGSNFQVDRRR